MHFDSRQVDLATAYSNRLDLANELVKTLERLRRAQEAEGDDRVSVRSTGRSDRPWRVIDRLSDADLRMLVTLSAEGMSKRTLAERYRISESSVKRIIRIPRSTPL